MRTRLLEARLQEGVLHRREEPGQPGSLLLGVHRERAWPLLFSWVRSAWLSFNTPGGLSDGTRNFEWGRGSQARGCLPPPTFLPEAAPTCQEPGSLAHPSRIRRVPWQGLPETKVSPRPLGRLAACKLRDYSWAEDPPPPPVCGVTER